MKEFNTYDQLLDILSEEHKDTPVKAIGVNANTFYKIYYLTHKKEHTTTGWASIDFPNPYGVTVFINFDYK